MIWRSKLARLRLRACARRLPRVIVLKKLDPAGVKFEVASLAERSRVITYGYEPEYLGAMLNTLRSDDVLYDVGANLGLVALHAARICQTVAFEPDPSFLARLQRNVELNPTLSVDVQPFAISDRNGTVTLYTDGAEGGSPSLVDQRHERQPIEVATRTLDALVAGGVLPVPTVLKVDIEGAEILALRGAGKLLRAPFAPRTLFLEVHDTFLPAFGSSAGEVLRLVHACGYETVRYQATRFDQQHLILGRQ